MPDDHDDTSRMLTWSALLGKWTEFAQAAVALPDDPEGERWKRAVPSVITLQAVTQALSEIDLVHADERELALDRAEMLCREHVAKLNEAWRGEPMPEGITDLIADSRLAFEAAANAGLEWRLAADRFVAQHPAGLQERLEKAGFRGELFLPSPGVPLFRGAVVAFARGPAGTPPDDDAINAIERFLGGRETTHPAERVPVPRQVYRQMNFGLGLNLGTGNEPAGAAAAGRDLIVPMNESLPPGQPLLMLVIDAGVPCAVPPPPTRPLRLDPLPVVEFDPSE